jgi:hypothetical protein
MIESSGEGSRNGRCVCATFEFRIEPAAQIKNRRGRVSVTGILPFGQSFPPSRTFTIGAFAITLVRGLDLDVDVGMDLRAVIDG